ncbi:MAG: hypothetical protein GXP32_06360 [Kiritimatiellaeota bacterium]|nr:hypothetical protein [Kiritimatiellota bacterium]
MTRLTVSFAVFCLLLAGCSTNYKLAAIKEARLYAMEQYPDFSEKSIHQIKFTKPEVQQQIIFVQESGGSKLDFAQTCFVWNLDDLDGKSLIIVGFGEKQLKDWYPIRSIVRRYRKIDDEKKKQENSKNKVTSDTIKKRRKRRMKRASK